MLITKILICTYLYLLNLKNSEKVKISFNGFYKVSILKFEQTLFSVALILMTIIHTSILILEYPSGERQNSLY